MESIAPFAVSILFIATIDPLASTRKKTSEEVLVCLFFSHSLLFVFETVEIYFCF